MLILSRLVDEEIVLRVPPSDTETVIRVMVVEVRSARKVRLGLSGEGVKINRGEIDAAIQREAGL